MAEIYSDPHGRVRLADSRGCGHLDMTIGGDEPLACSHCGTEINFCISCRDEVQREASAELSLDDIERLYEVLGAHLKRNHRHLEVA